MAIIGKVEDILKQNNVSEKVKKGLTFLHEINLLEIFLGIENGNSNIFEIDDKNIFAVFSSYQTQINTPAIFEGHRKYIDIHYIIKGEEAIFVTSDNVTDLNEYSSENDCQLCKSNSSSTFILKPGVAAILYPEDWHAPGQHSNRPENVLKVVVKVAID